MCSRVEDGELDVDRFERLVGGGAQALARDRPADAAARLREALALWRGPPLADVAYEAFAQPEIARLEERRIAALEQRIDADLALGRHADLVAELEGLVAEHPLRERLRAQLMVALYRSGRQADALEAFGAARRALLDELGVEPGPALRELQAAILRQDPELAPAPRGLAAPARRPGAGSRCWPSAAPCWPARPSRRRCSRAATPRRSGCGSGRTPSPRSTSPTASVKHAVDVGPSPSHLAAGGRRSGSPTPTGAASRVSTSTTTASGRPSPSATAPPALPSPEARSGWPTAATARSRDRREHEHGRAAIPVGANPTGVAAGAGAVWVANAGEQTISRIDPRSGRATTIDVHAEPTGWPSAPPRCG